MTRPKIINRSILATLSVGVLGTAIALAGSANSEAASTSAESVTRSSTAPEAIAVPAGNVAIADFAAQGVQVYQCTAGAWVFVEPAANLLGRTLTRPITVQTAVHFRGPSWESTTDGSLVTATAVANSPVPGSIAQLLLKAATNRGDGIFGKVSYIQRLNTTGGTAPAGACTSGTTTGVRYTASYRFFAPATS
jgi:hypothetical protein